MIVQVEMLYILVEMMGGDVLTSDKIIEDPLINKIKLILQWP